MLFRSTDFDRLAVQPRKLDRAAQRGRREADRRARDQRRPFPGKDRVRLRAYLDIDRA